MNQKEHECIECEHWRCLLTDTPRTCVIGDLIPEQAEKTVTIQDGFDYCKLGHTSPKGACKDFKKTPDFIC